jgi:hypothetical protein
MTTTYFVAVAETWPRSYAEVAAEKAPARGERFVPAPEFVLQSELGGSFDKPKAFVVRGTSRDELLVQALGDYSTPEMTTMRPIYAEGSWHTIPMDYSVEGHRFVRKIRKVVDVLLKIAREVQKAQKKAEKAEKDFADRGERCGMCPVCFGDYVVASSHDARNKRVTSKMVHHGYQRPGIGYIVGDCHGVGFEPFEISCEGTKSWLKVLGNTLVARKDALSTIDTRDSVSVVVGMKRVTRYHSIPERQTLQRGEPGFDRAIADLKRELERDVRSLERDIAEYEGKIAAWAPAPWPRKKAS